MKVLRKAKKTCLSCSSRQLTLQCLLLTRTWDCLCQEQLLLHKRNTMIMPVIFVLTALLDLWVPKEKIMKYLGKEKRKGVVLSL